MNPHGRHGPAGASPAGLGRLGQVVRAGATTHAVTSPDEESDDAPGAAPAAATQACDMCAAPITEPHQHVVDVQSRSLRCTCRPCWLLFTDAGAGRYQAVGEAVGRLDLDLPAGTWARLDVPVGLLFVMQASGVEGPAAFYPSPAGATESALDLSAWAEVRAADPAVAAARPDVEAVLLDGRDAHGPIPAWVVPIDRCYELVGLVRSHWRGFDGGTAAHAAIGTFLADLDERASARAVG
ncbi:DUF5947 family protein [soil metagenome]